MKIQKIEVRNFKAVAKNTAMFEGCSAMITAGNNKGKTSILRGLIDRFRGEKPDLILKEGTLKGFNTMELTDGAIIEWKFTEKTESFSFTTKEGIKQTTGVLSTIGKRYFGLKFDIDKFLRDPGQKQTKELQRLVGLDFTDIDSRYQIAYDERTDANREVKRLSALNVQEPEKIEEPNSDLLKEDLLKAKTSNIKLKERWDAKNKIHQQDTLDFNEEQDLRKVDIDEAESSMEILNKLDGGIFIECIDFSAAKKIQEELPAVEEKKILTSLTEPNYISEDAIQLKINGLNDKVIEYNNYKTTLGTYNNHLQSVKDTTELQTKCNMKVQDIEAEKLALIQSADIPKDFEITPEGILYKGLPLTDNQISTSGKYIAALKLGSLVLGEVKTMHFEASSLDKNSLSEIQDWANENDLQLLIERPDFNCGKIKYEILSK